MISISISIISIISIDPTYAHLEMHSAGHLLLMWIQPYFFQIVPIIGTRALPAFIAMN